MIRDLNKKKNKQKTLTSSSFSNITLDWSSCSWNIDLNWSMFIPGVGLIDWNLLNPSTTNEIDCPENEANDLSTELPKTEETTPLMNSETQLWNRKNFYYTESNFRSTQKREFMIECKKKKKVAFVGEVTIFFILPHFVR